MKFYAPGEVQPVCRALAFENRMLEDPAGEEGLLFCWTGEPAVVMGKNQNPWRECNLEFIRERGCRLARRVSGGGTVYHDPGNLNISWILPREGYRPEMMHRLFLRALARLDVVGEVGAGGSLTVNGKKISGSAFCYRKDRVLHHGTLLLHADLNRLQAALSPPGLQMETHAVDSVPAQVMNLKLEKVQVIAALKQEAEAIWGALMDVEGDLSKEEDGEMTSDSWIWDQTPAFGARIPLSGKGEFHFNVRKGILTECRLNEKKLALDQQVKFPDGDFSQLEEQLGLSEGDLKMALNQKGWEKI